MVPTDIKRLWLRRIYSLTTAGGGTAYTTLTAALNAHAFVALDAIKGGTISSTSARDHAVAFSNRDNGATPEDMAAMCGELLDLYDAARASLVYAGDASPSDSEIKDDMLDRLVAIAEYQPQFCNIREVSA